VANSLEKNTRIETCPLEGVIDVIGRKWALLIINAIGTDKKARFNQLMDELQIVSPKTLSDTLKQLQKEELIKREAFSEIPPRVEYSLTADGLGLWNAIMPLLRWTASKSKRKGNQCQQYCKLRESLEPPTDP
jgi:DNA-binding HxlR family transcriptional regulator